MWAELACPFDHGALEAGQDWLACHLCGRGYPIVDGVPTFLPTRESARWRQAQQTRLDRLAIATPEGSFEMAARSRRLRRQSREIETVLSRFVALDAASRVLQIGVEGESEVQYFSRGSRYAVEPLAGFRWARGDEGNIRWVAGRGEELPFPAGVFQAVLLAGVLDCVESPRQVLAEASRVLAPHGALWLSSPVVEDRSAAAHSLLPIDARFDSAEEIPSDIRLRNFTYEDLLRVCREAGFLPVWQATRQPARILSYFDGSPTLCADEALLQVVLRPTIRPEARGFSPSRHAA